MEETRRVSGIGFCGMLTLVFIIFKLAGIGAIATWPWRWVLSPIWIPMVILFICIVVYCCIDD